MLDPDPLHVDDERIPSSKPYRLVPDSPRRGCSVLGFLVLASLVFVGSATPRAASEPIAAAGELRAVQGQPGAPHREAGHDPVGAPQPAVASAALASRPVGSRSFAIGETPTTGNGGQSMPAQDASAVTWEGTLAFALPSYGDRYLAIRQPRGTRVVICGPAACVTRISTDFGPSLEMARQGRIADVSAADFERLCGMDVAQRVAVGLCPGTLTLVALPNTDQ